MVSRVECETIKWFNVLNTITWRKEFSWYSNSKYNPARCSAKALRSYYDQTERIIFAEHYGADNIAKGEAGYGAKCDELCGFVFEPLRAYLAYELSRSGLKWDSENVVSMFKEHTQCKTNQSALVVSKHKLDNSYIQWQMLTQKQYLALRNLLNGLNCKNNYLQRPYEDLRKEYEYLRKEYEDLRRPFTVSAEVPYTDVWTFKTVMNYNGKHPCEKPLDMLEHMINASSRTGATVLDCFMGTGNTGVACAKLGRKFIGIDKTEKYFKAAEQRISAAYAGNFKAAISTRRQQKQQHADLFSENAG